MLTKKEHDKNKLKREIISRIKTVMIGAVASIENHLGELWGFKEKRQLTRVEEELVDKFTALRKEILDRGNNEIRAITNTLETYDIDYVGYVLELKLPVVRK